jgi:hypothetical protein
MEAVSGKRIQHWQNEISRYLANGNRLPAPFAHFDPDSKKPIIFGKDGTLLRSDLNGGFWDKAEAAADPDLGITLFAELEADGDENNINTAAGKIGKTVRETSIFVVPEFEDGHGNKYTDFPAHIALVTHPIQPGQPNFESIPGTLALAMSQLAYMAVPPQTKNRLGGTEEPKGSNPPKEDAPPQGDPTPAGSTPINASSPSLDQIIAQLRQCGIALPQDTNEQNFLSYLSVALGQKSLTDGGDEGSVYEPPEGATQKSPAPVAMSNQPITAENFHQITKEVFMSHPAAKELAETNAVLLQALTAQARTARRARIDAIVASHPEMKDYAEKTLLPMLETFQMSLAPNSPSPPLDTILVGLESLPPSPAAAAANRNALLQHTAQLAMSAQAPPNPFMSMSGAAPTGADTKSVLDQFWNNTGGAPNGGK